MCYSCQESRAHQKSPVGKRIRRTVLGVPEVGAGQEAKGHSLASELSD